MAKKPASAGHGGRLIPRDGSVVVRMYRIGHGDCFLIAFPGKKPKQPVYVLIDCGYKPGSPGKIKDPRTAKEITASIREATGGHIDVAVITHEHQDHVNAITETHFTNMKIGEAWFAWTEDPDDGVADDLRKTYKDKLLGLIAARNRLAADGDTKRAERIEEFLAFELGGDDDEPFNVRQAGEVLAAAGKGGASMNKKSMKLFKDRAERGPKFLRPHSIRQVPGADGIRVFALGPPRDPDQLRSLDPEGDEQFHLASLAAATPVGYFGAAAVAADTGTGTPAPFASRYCVPLSIARQPASPHAAFLGAHYGNDGDAPAATANPYEVPGNADWRRIDRDWLFSAEQLALDMNKHTNNSSLVLAFELSPGGKVLLFAADAQRGNWVSWSKKEWKDGDKKVTARDLLSRTVLYKVGHHGSHNATLNGTPADEYPNIAWMAQGDHGREFTAMITAVRKWAETQDGWDHPLKAIKDALLKKAGGRVFQTDTDFEDMEMHANGAKADWNRFQSRASGHRLYFDYVVPIE